jgi:hypothetical protein
MEVPNEIKKGILDEIIKNHMVSSYETNILFRTQLSNIFNTYYLQNSKFHLMWLFFHSFSFAYPEEPSDEYKIETANFITNVIPKNLGGCGGCQNDYKTYIEKLNVFRIVSSKQELSTFFVDLHNYINNKKFEKQNRNVTNNFNILTNEKEKISAPIFFNYEDVKSMYEETDYISLLEEKYSINIFNLIDSKSLATFYDNFNKIKFDLYDNKFNIGIFIK